MKRPLEEKEEEENEAEMEAEPKRACMDEANEDMEEFFALLKRIAATEKPSRGRKEPNEQTRMGKCEPLWRPAFVWEDFSTDSNGNRTRDVESNPHEEDKEVDILHDNKNSDNNINTYDLLNRVRSPSSDINISDNEGLGIQRLDLNLPSSGLQYFF